MFISICFKNRIGYRTCAFNCQYTRGNVQIFFYQLQTLPVNNTPLFFFFLISNIQSYGVFAISFLAFHWTRINVMDKHSFSFIVTHVLCNNIYYRKSTAMTNVVQAEKIRILIINVKFFFFFILLFEFLKALEYKILLGYFLFSE